MENAMNGFYIAYLTGAAGNSVLVFVLMNGKFVGADVGGMKYDGTFERKSDGTGIRCSIVYVVPPGKALITGAQPSPSAITIPLAFDLPREFADGRVITIETPRGAVNARFEKVRDI
jgi:hypothetical protein